nr:site-specific integrase [uncultured Cellulosilyticum sp.]
MSIDKRGERTWRFRVKHNRQLYTMNYEAPLTLTLKQAEKEAEKQHMIFKADVIAGRVSLVKDITMNHLIDNVYNEYVKSLKYQTQTNYKMAYNNYIIPEFGTMNLHDIKPLHVQKFVNKISEKLSPSTVHLIVSCLKKTFNIAIAWQYIEQNKNPCLALIEPKKNKATGELMSLTNLEKLINYYMNEEKNTLHKLAFCLAIGCGLRNSEIRALELSDIDFKNNMININKQSGSELSKDGSLEHYKDISTKTDSSNRIIYAPQFVMDVAIEHINKMDYFPATNKLFYSKTTKNVVAVTCLYRHFKKVLVKLDLPIIRFHDLRKLQATLLIQYGANIKAVSKRLGHSKVDITLNTYTSTIDEVDKQLAKDFETAFNNLKSNL